MLRSIKNRASSVFRKKKKAETTTVTPDLPVAQEFISNGNAYFSAVPGNNNSSFHNLSPPPPPPPYPSTSVISTASTQSEQQQQYQPEPTNQDPAEDPAAPDPPTSDPFAPKYVPYIEASPLKNNMFGGNAGRYGRVNPDIMGGFGGDDDSIWLVDDEETDEDRQRQQQETQSRNSSSLDHPSRTGSRQSGSSSLHHPASTQLQEPGPAPPSTSSQPAFRYHMPSLLDDDEFISGNLSSTTSAPQPPPRSKHHPGASAWLRPINPYVALFEQQDDAMTLAYLRQLERSGDDAADDFRFGQRYQQARDSPDVIVTHQRTPASTVTGELECLLAIESDLNSKLWTEIRCPECRELLEYADIQRYANKQTFTRYETLALRAAMSEADNFIWCTSGCGSGQIHESGAAQPIVTCLHCNHRSCFHHNVAWHETLSCNEYDQLLADPDNFRSHLEIENEKWSEAQQAQLEADRAMAQGLLAEERAELKRREERARQEREQAERAAKLARQIAARRKREEEQSKATVNRTTKPCPGCGWAIEKNDGCSHMTCIKCKHQFCFECGADHRDIIKGDNSVHEDTCPFHPNNLKD
ncbi:hypothetical protein NM208_g6661 [Fusarium decemcellulare]|uniref:Uncharacterized protein n=1 Tax=Fusarium decemcellulare TaxID=57161 RepID=A0ACC1SC70_9HYPO|nr:hypothetical protein NM208_g6661 [Fusarium decemcellulare]